MFYCIAVRFIIISLNTMSIFYLWLLIIIIRLTTSAPSVAVRFIICKTTTSKMPRKAILHLTVFMLKQTKNKKIARRAARCPPIRRCEAHNKAWFSGSDGIMITSDSFVQERVLVCLSEPMLSEYTKQWLSEKVWMQTCKLQLNVICS